MKGDRRLGLPKGVKIIEDFGWGYCKRCGRFKDLRFGVCFDCATEEEKGFRTYRFKKSRGGCVC